MKIVLNPQYDYLKAFINELPTFFSNKGDVIYSGRNTIKIYNTEGVAVSVKSFKCPILVNQVVYSFFRKSKAERSYEYGTKLIEKGYNTPAPIAYIENKKAGLFKDSYYVSIYEEFDGMMRELQTGVIEDREDLLTQFAQYTANLHNDKVLHLDYSPGNILYKKNGNIYTFYLVDLNRMEFDKPVDVDAGCKNFSRLWGSDDMITFIVKIYAKVRGFDEKICLEKTFKYREEFWIPFMERHPDATPYIG